MRASTLHRRLRIWITTGLIAVATWTTSPRAAYADGLLTGDFANTLGFISNAYGAFQAGQFSLEKLNILPSEVGAAKREILEAIHNVQIEDLAGTVDGILSTFELVMASPGNPYHMGLVTNIITNSDIVIGKIRQALAEKNLDKSYRLAVPFNVIVVTNAMARGIAGFSSSLVLAKFASTLTINYGLVGADQVLESNPAYWIINTSDTGFFWKKFNDVAHWCSSDDYTECNLHDGYCIKYNSPAGIWGRGTEVIPSQEPVCWNETWHTVYGTFIRDPVVRIVRRVNYKLAQQLPFFHVTDSYGPGTILSASDLDQYPQCRSGRCHF
jgi:hypothetical protein